MMPHLPRMRKNVAEALGIEENQVSIKATTEEGLGFTGSGEGISAQAICLLLPLMDLVSNDAMASGCCQGCGR